MGRRPIVPQPVLNGAMPCSYRYRAFHEPIGSGALEITGRFLAFCLVITGAAAMPAPLRATPDAGSGLR